MRKVLKLVSIAIIGGASINTVAMERGLPGTQNNQIKQNVVQVPTEEEPTSVITPEQQLEMRKLVNDFCATYSKYVSVKVIEPTLEEKQETNDDGPFFIITINDSQKADGIVTNANNFPIELRRRILFEECPSPDQEEDEGNYLRLVGYYKLKKAEQQERANREKLKIVFRKIRIGPYMTKQSIEQLLMIYPLNLDMDNVNYKIMLKFPYVPSKKDRPQFITMIQRAFRIPEKNIEKIEDLKKIFFFAGKSYSRPAKNENYEAWISTNTNFSQDKSRYIMLTNTINTRWTSCQWFNFEMPSNLLYNWALDVFPDLKGKKFVLKAVLNHGQSIYIGRNYSSTRLRDLCAIHRIELYAVPPSAH